MTTTVDVEDLQTTKSEKLLAFVMVVFLLIGGGWAYQKIDDRVRSAIELGEPTAAERRRSTGETRPSSGAFRADRRSADARREVEFRREEFRAALDADGRRRARAPLPRRRAPRSQAAPAGRSGGRGGGRRAARRECGPAAGGEAPRSGATGRSSSRSSFASRSSLVSLARRYLALARLRSRNSRYPAPRRGAARVRDDPRLRRRGRLPDRLLQPARRRAAPPLAARRRCDCRRVLDCSSATSPGACRSGGSGAPQCPFCGYPVRGNDAARAAAARWCRRAPAASARRVGSESSAS